MLKLFLIFSVSLFICEAVKPITSVCPSIRLKYGRVRYRQKGRFAKFVCNVGYIIAGEKYSTCANGTWDGAIPKCVRASCKKVNPPMNGLIYPSHRGAVLNFFCNPRYDLRGTTTVYCDGNNWDESLPTCLLTNTKPALGCNFETADLCGWNHDLRHDFDWTRMNLKTPSGHLGTGPSFDHTFGKGKDGYYMYIESSSRKVNDTARLISPIYDKMDDTNVCLEFFYHMHGASTGQLRVYLKRVSDTWILYPENSIFWKVGNHGDKWLHSFMDLGPINEDFQIIIEGVRGTSFFSDIAVDDISIIPNCTIKDITTERDDVVTADYIPTQSCLNRCDSDNIIPFNPFSIQASCGCDETCTDNNACCPDYIALCVIGVTEDANTTETTVALNRTSTTVTVQIIYNTTAEETTNASETTGKPSSTTALTTLRSTLRSSTTTSPKPETSSSMRTSPRASFKPTKPPVPETKVTVKLNVSIKPSSIPNKIPSLPTKYTKPTNVPPKLPTFTKYIVKSVSSIATTQSDDDFVTVPVRINYRDSEEKIVAPVVSKPIEAHPSVQKDTVTQSNTVVIIAVAACVVVLLVLGVALFKRYSCKRSRIRGSGSESQSDVRFLTSDEVLDFNLAYGND